MLSLGISYGIHDSAACIARDGEVVFAVAEERLSRRKHDQRFPELSIRACLEHVGASADDLDFASLSWPKPLRQYRHDLACIAAGRYPRAPRYPLVATAHFLRRQRESGGLATLMSTFHPARVRPRFVEHHLAHAISAYACSGFKDATVVVADGRGAWEATSIWYGRDGRLEPVETIPFPNSLGLFYAEFTYYLGFEKYSDEWKVMGLAPFGQPGFDLGPFLDCDIWPYRVDAVRLLGREPQDASGIESAFGPRRKPESELTQRHKDLAFAVQEASERAMLALTRHAVERTGCPDVCLAGGVALNAKANGLVAAAEGVRGLFIQPAAGDDGAAIGAALFPHLETDGRLPAATMHHAYLGPGYDTEIEAALRTYKLRPSRATSPAKTAAEALAAGKIVGWYQGRMEFGPRALGARSILADPREAEVRDRVNAAVKFRESWRPFAPSILAEEAPACLEGSTDSPFMIQIAAVRPEWRERLGAVTHIDGTTRPQTVAHGVNPPFRELIEVFYAKTGVPAVLNTSFNLRGEPIVCSPSEAIRTFYTSGMDALVLGDFVIEK